MQKRGGVAGAGGDIFVNNIWHELSNNISLMYTYVYSSIESFHSSNDCQWMFKPNCVLLSALFRHNLDE